MTDTKALRGLLENANVTLPLVLNGGDDYGNFWIDDVECKVLCDSNRFEDTTLIVEAINALPDLLTAYEERDRLKATVIELRRLALSLMPAPAIVRQIAHATEEALEPKQ